MKKKFKFTFENLKKEYRDAQEVGYEFLTCEEYVQRRNNLGTTTIVNRVDIGLLKQLKIMVMKLDIILKLWIKQRFGMNLQRFALKEICLFFNPCLELR